MEKYNRVVAVLAQRQYCNEKNLPNFALDGFCYRCGRNAFDHHFTADGYDTGISVEQAGKHHVTYCPHCNASFDD